MFIIIYGPEGSGKTTQGRLLAKKLGIPHLISGDLVRDACQNDRGLIGNACRQAMENGKYVADSEMYVLWKRRLKQNDVKKGWVMDGFPRNITQLRFLERKLSKYKQKISRVFYLEVSARESMKRLLKRGRPDDTEILIKNRLKHYHRGEKTILAYFKDMGVLEKVNGQDNIQKVHQHIWQRVKKWQSSLA